MELTELLEEAKRRYPPGTVIKSDYSGNQFVITSNTNPHDAGDGIQLHGTKGGESTTDNPYVYYKGKWAEIINEIKQFLIYN